MPEFPERSKVPTTELRHSHHQGEPSTLFVNQSLLCSADATFLAAALRHILTNGEEGTATIRARGRRLPVGESLESKT